MRYRYEYAIYSRKKPLKNSLGVKFPQQKIAREMHDEIFAKHTNGVSTKDLANEYEVSEITIRRIIRLTRNRKELKRNGN